MSTGEYILLLASERAIEIAGRQYGKRVTLSGQPIIERNGSVKVPVTITYLDAFDPVDVLNAPSVDGVVTIRDRTVDLSANFTELGRQRRIWDLKAEPE